MGIIVSSKDMDECPNFKTGSRDHGHAHFMSNLGPIIHRLILAKDCLSAKFKKIAAPVPNISWDTHKLESGSQNNF